MTYGIENQEKLEDVPEELHDLNSLTNYKTLQNNVIIQVVQGFFS